MSDSNKLTANQIDHTPTTACKRKMATATNDNHPMSPTAPSTKSQIIPPSTTLPSPPSSSIDTTSASHLTSSGHFASETLDSSLVAIPSTPLGRDSLALSKSATADRRHLADRSEFGSTLSPVHGQDSPEAGNEDEAKETEDSEEDLYEDDDEEEEEDDEELEHEDEDDIDMMDIDIDMNDEWQVRLKESDDAGTGSV